MFLFGIGFRNTRPKKVLQKKREKEDRILIVDETLIKISNQFVWIWIAIDSTDKIILGVHISIERTMLIAE